MKLPNLVLLVVLFEIICNASTANDKDGQTLFKKWKYNNLQKQNLEYCPSSCLQPIEEALQRISSLQGQLESVSGFIISRLNAAQSDILSMSSTITKITGEVVPVGFIYVEYNKQANPVTLWPNFNWTDVTRTYAGLFFRASGAGSGPWGFKQEECAPRISQVEFTQSIIKQFPRPLSISANGWSSRGLSGYNGVNTTSPKNYETLRFYTSGCEVRPKNLAIRV